MAKVLVVGPHEQTRAVQGYLTNYDALCQGSSPTAEMDVLPSFMSLETKYYSARLDLFLCELERGGEAEELGGKEGYLMCLSVEMANNTASVVSRQELFAKGEAAEDAGISIRILVILGRDVTLSEEARGAWINWSLDHGFELIEIDSSGLTDSWKEREKEGLPRLMEALQANMWSSMVRKEASGSSSSSSSGGGGAVGGSGGGSSSVSSTSSVFEFHNKQGIATESKQEATSEASTGASAFDEQYFRRMREADETNEQNAQAVDLPVLDEGGEHNDSSSELPAADASLDRFADILAQAKSTREAALSGKLSDHDRRAQAAQMAMQLSQLLSMAGEDEDDEDEDEDEDVQGKAAAAGGGGEEGSTK